MSDDERLAPYFVGVRTEQAGHDGRTLLKLGGDGHYLRSQIEMLSNHCVLFGCVTHAHMAFKLRDKGKL